MARRPMKAARPGRRVRARSLKPIAGPPASLRPRSAPAGGSFGAGGISAITKPASRGFTPMRQPAQPAPVPMRLTGRANAITRGQGKKLGLRANLGLAATGLSVPSATDGAAAKNDRRHFPVQGTMVNGRRVGIPTTGGSAPRPRSRGAR